MTRSIVRVVSRSSRRSARPSGASIVPLMLMMTSWARSCEFPCETLVISALVHATLAFGGVSRNVAGHEAL